MTEIPKAQSIRQFIQSHDCAHLPDGEMEIEGRQLFVRIMSYTPKAAQENRFEIHKIHADVQYVVQGSELMQTADLKDLTPLTEYDPKGDYQFFKPKGHVQDKIIETGEFIVFYPNCPHRPGCTYEGQNGPVKKLVFKVKIH